MGKSSPHPPPAPDPVAAAQAQGAANKEAIQESYKDAAVNQYAPWGSTTFQRDATTGIPTSQTITLSPEGMDYYNNATGIANTLADKASSLADYIPSGPLSFDGLPAWVSSLNTSNLQSTSTPNLQKNIDTSNLPDLNTDFADQNTRARDAVFNSGKALLDPVFSQQNDQLEQKLADQGLPTGSKAYTSAWDQQQRQQNQQWQNLANSAVTSGNQEAAQLFGMNKQAYDTLFSTDTQQGAFANNAQLSQLQAEQQLRQQGLSEEQIQAQLQDSARQQGISEAQGLRSQALNEASALIQGAPAMQSPSFQGTPTFAQQPAPIASSIYNSAGINNQNYWQSFQANQQNQQQTMSTIASIASIAALAFL